MIRQDSRLFPNNLYSVFSETIFAFQSKSKFDCVEFRPEASSREMVVKLFSTVPYRTITKGTNSVPYDTVRYDNVPEPVPEPVRYGTVQYCGGTVWYGTVHL